MKMAGKLWIIFDIFVYDTHAITTSLKEKSDVRMKRNRLAIQISLSQWVEDIKALIPLITVIVICAS